MTEQKKLAPKKPKKNTPHDALIKKIMENPIAARELLEEYLPESFKDVVDLSTVKIEKESYVEKHLVKQLSDVVLSLKTKENEQAFVYVLLEAQINPDYWIAFRLWKYILLLSERHMTAKDKLPLVCPLVLYHGTKKYDAPKNLWQLFADPYKAKEMLTNDYPLIDLESMDDSDINYDKHLSMILYLMKHVNERDTLKMLEEVFKRCHKALLIDQRQDYIYTKLAIWYIDNKIPLEQKPELEQLVIDNLPKEHTEDIMKTIAQAYIEEGEVRGEVRGIAIGEARGVAIGEARAEARAEARTAKNLREMAIKMLRQNLDLNFVSSVTTLSPEELLILKNSL